MKLINGRHAFQYLAPKYARCASSTARLRFAPSPTGDLHLGGLRTALYNYLFARQRNGKFILRLEDTDHKRLVPGASERILQDLKWVGLQPDEGPGLGGDYGPYTQSERQDIYIEHVQHLIKTGHAYYCFCNEKRLELLRKEAHRTRQIAKYDNRCRNISWTEANNRIKDREPYCVRFKLNADNDCCEFDDLIYGRIQYDVTKNEGDTIILKSDGFPTYHIANVVDDHLMKISHVLRGVEWQISTTKHLMLYKAFGWTPPIFGHLPLLMDERGQKLSKRNNDLHVKQFRETGYFPNALINYIISSGGGFVDTTDKDDKLQCYNLSQLIERFNVSIIKTSHSKLDTERLRDLNQLELRKLYKLPQTRADLVKNFRMMIRNHLNERNELELQLNSEHVETVLRWSVDRIHKLSDLLHDDYLYLWCLPDAKQMEYAEADVEVVRKLVTALDTDQIYMNKDVLNRFLRKLADDCRYSYPSLMQLFRKLLSGLQRGPGVAEMLVILGRQNSLLRLKMFIDNTKS